jgi:D-alanyl-D-alanine carboxypeptidase
MRGFGKKKRAWHFIVPAVLILTMLIYTTACTGSPQTGKQEAPAGDQTAGQQTESPGQNTGDSHTQGSAENPADDPGKDSGVQTGPAERPENPGSASQSLSEAELLLLVNKKNLLDGAYTPEGLRKVKGQSYKMRDAAASALENLLSAASADGITNLKMFSGYRTYDYQKTLFDRKVEQYRSRYGEGAVQAASMIVAIPGTSEHQTGLAADVAISSLETTFGDTKAGRWLEEHCANYGFIIRYPKDKTAITGVSYEPWHLRYVGVEHAKKIMQQGICLEEYLQGFYPDLGYNY